MATICSAYGPIHRIDYDLIMAAGHDHASRLARKACRATWNDDDYNSACDKIDELTKAAAGNFPAHLFKIAEKISRIRKTA